VWAPSVDHASALFLLVLTAIAALTVAARVFGVPYPVALVIGGLGLGAIPGLPKPELEPELVLGLFLPPLLYSAAFFASLRDMRNDLRTISLLAVGLVVATTVTVAVVAHAVIGLPWAVAFAFGAIVSPTDPLAASAIGRRVGAPRRIMTIVEGESLINDGTALVLYKTAVAAAVGGTFSFWESGGKLVGGALAGVAVGFAVGAVVAEIRRRIDDPPVEITISLATGYAAYLPAEALGASGVLAAVSAGVYVGWLAPAISTPAMRMQGTAVWELLQFLLNAVLFVLIGLQLPTIADGIGGRSAAEVAGLSALMWATVIGTRLLWVNATTFVIRALDRRASQRARRGTWRARIVITWAGMRGAVSLAAALALPLDVAQRDLIVSLTFGVILGTLVVQGLTLAPLLHALRVEDDGSEAREEVHARISAAEAALERLVELAEEAWTNDDTIERLTRAYRYRVQHFSARRDGEGDGTMEDRSIAYQRTLRELFNTQRAKLVELRNGGTISNEVMHRIERELDLEEERLEI
jgi:Na+/H+ antiporter